MMRVDPFARKSSVLFNYFESYSYDVIINVYFGITI